MRPGEIYRHRAPEPPPFLNDFRLSELRTNAQRVVDYSDLAALGVAPGDLSHDSAYGGTQALRVAAGRGGLEDS